MRYKLLFFILPISCLFAANGKTAKTFPIQTNIPTPPLAPTIQKKAAPLIVLDAGHGGMDKGTSSDGFDEKNPTLKTAFLAQKYLQEKGYRVLLTRTNDTFIPLAKRAQIANDSHCKLFVSIHFNAAQNQMARGIEIYYFNAKEPWRLKSSKKLSTCVMHRIIANTGAKSRGVKTGNFHVIRETQMPAILVEGGFITNKTDRALIKDERYLDRLARSIAEGVDRYFKSP